MALTEEPFSMEYQSQSSTVDSTEVEDTAVMTSVGHTSRRTVLDRAAARSRPSCTTLLLVLSDLLALLLAWGISVAIGLLFQPSIASHACWGAWPLFALFPLVYLLSGLYPAVGLCPPEELKRLSLTTTWGYLAVGGFAFVLHLGSTLSRPVLIGAWILSLILVPLIRALAREMWAARGWWGHSALILGAGRTGALVIDALRRFPGLGLNPVCVLDDDPSKWGELDGVPVGGDLELAPEFSRKLGIRYAIVAMPGVECKQLSRIIARQACHFPHLIVIPDLFGFSTMWILGRDLGGILSLEMRQRLLMPIPRMVKRLMDTSLGFIASVLLLPLILLLALLIRLESPGAPFYGHTRIGRGGRRFRAWKLRTMVQNADQVLEQHLEQHPELRQEWEELQKLRDDPRITRVGRWLRKTSLDELPQLWNVLVGEMSLVGPRPIVENEIARYGDLFDTYLQVRPGLTGLWQVSGRNDTTYEERVRLDAYYVRNWSPWLDIYILARTVLVVFGRKGAY